jgi:hypothetical protein
MVCNPPAWITQLFARLHKGEEVVRLLPEARDDQDAMEIDISDMCSDYKTVSKNASELFWEITQNQSFESALVGKHFNEIVQDCERFSNELWTAISGLHNDTEGKENVHTDHANRINDHLCVLKGGDDY